ncbi:uroporphyrinogen decarboxylase [Alicyclobacillus sp. SO9]|uniref:uroporphyrinogen decarboxylase n=1 Tax=Alicyclobacillus sp. SO9 TaxID=2665646 RepID=UPI0018E901D2|nr:uroporphyrinogen decarboxylase [Alicyclobacillus sp. SO9]QQE77432.1 uroporphyrinogen decarboxylase [Alicyclobacillus sp. SO9]
MQNQTFLDACWQRPTDYTPVWYMRQAGRYQPEYRKIREKYSLLEICRIPEVCAEVTKLPVSQLGVDAAILFSDISVPIGAMGRNFDIQENVGPVMEHPIRTETDIAQLQVFDPREALPYVLDTIMMLKADLEVPLIGFAGAPFTLASYMVEGGPSRDYIQTKQMMWKTPALWNSLMDKLTTMTVKYLRAQIEAGASAVQLFDSWVGALSPADYRKYVLPVMKRIFTELKDLQVPTIYFGVGTGELLQDFTETGAHVIGVDWRVPLSEARKRIGLDHAIQGNLDPAAALTSGAVTEEKTKQIIDAGIEHPGHIFNLGHGVLRSTPVENLQRLTALVHEYSAKVKSEVKR